MSNLNKDHPSVRVHAPPGGHSSNIFSTSEFEQSAANKKKQSGSDIFGSKQDNAEPAPVKQNRNVGNNIFGADAEETNAKAGTLAGQYKQTQMKSNIFGADEPTSTRVVSDKNKSNIFGADEPAPTRVVSDKNKSNVFGADEPASTTRVVSDKNKSNIFGADEPASSRTVSDKNKSNIFGVGDDEHKRQAGGRHGLRVGYNPINGEAYSAKENVNSKTNENDKQPDITAKIPVEENGNGQAAPTNSAENGNGQAAPTNSVENANAQAVPTNSAEKDNAQKPVEKTDDATNGNNAQKNVHTSVRVFHPPGGKSNGPLW